MRRLSALACIAVLAAACSSAAGTATDTRQPVEQQATSETEPQDAGFWANVPNGDNLRRIIDEDAAAADCAALQETFDTWDASDLDAAVKAELLVYIDEALGGAGCYE